MLPTYNDSLIDNLDLSVVDRSAFNGTDDANDPRFVTPVDPASAPTAAGDLRLRGGSPVLDRGDNAANGEEFDLSGNARIQDGTIDLGAYEGAVRVVATIAGRHIFYNQSAWDDNEAEANANDAIAIAADKSALLNGGVATFANYSSPQISYGGVGTNITANFCGRFIDSPPLFPL